MKQETYTPHDPERVQMMAKTVSTGAQLLAAATSCFILFTVIYNQLPEAWPLLMRKIFTGVMTAGIVAVIELFPRHMLPGTFDAMSRGIKNAWLYVSFTLFLCLFLQGISVLTSYHSRDLIAEAIIKKPSLVDDAGFSLARDSLITAKQLEYDTRIHKLEENRSERLTEAHKDAQQLLTHAIASKGGEMKRLYHKGNGWAAKQLSGAIGQAKREGGYLIAQEEARGAQLTSERDSVIQAMQTQAEKQVGLFQSSNGQKQARYDEQKARYQGYAAFIGIGGTIVFLLMQIFLALHRKHTGLRLEYKEIAPTVDALRV